MSVNLRTETSRNPQTHQATTPISTTTELSTAHYFWKLHEKNLEFNANIRGMVNQAYNRLLEERGLTIQLIPGGEDLEQLGIDQSTAIVRPDLYDQAFRDVIFNARISKDCSTGIFNFLKNDPTLASLPSACNKILEKLLDLTIRIKCVADPLSPEKRQLNQEISQKKIEFNSICQESNIDTNDGNPLIFQKINDMANSLAAEIIIFKKRELVQSCRKGINLSELSPNEFEKLYEKCFEEMQAIKQVKAKISYLIQFAKLPNAIKDSYSLSIFHSGHQQSPFTLTTKFIPLGYSIHDLLFGLNIFSGNYDGTEEFHLSPEQFKKLNGHLSNLKLWADDFSLIVGDLIGKVDEVANYVALGQKPISEIMRNPIRMSSSVIQKLPQYQDKPCLLFNQISLDLKNHPERDFLKEKFIGFYKAEKMIGSNGLPKEFLNDDPYRSVLNVEQVMKICPRLNKLLKFQQLVKEFTNTNSLQEALATLKAFEIPNELECMKQYKIGVLNEIYRSILGNRTPGNLIANLDQTLNVCTTIDSLEGKSLELCEELLKQRTGSYFRKKETIYEPSAEEIRALYEGDRMKTYAGNQRHKDIAKLISKLKATPAFRTALAKSPDLASSVSEYEAEMVHRLNTYHTLAVEGFYGRRMVDEAVQYLETYVAKIVYIDKSKVTQESIERSLVVLAGRNGADLSHGCNTGLSGRNKDVLLTLITSVGNDLHDHMNQFRKECLEAIYQEISYYRDNSESSMAIPEKAEASKFLGLEDSSVRRSYDELSYGAQGIVQQFFVRYTPVSIYHKARTFFSDKFWQLSKDDDREKIYQLFADLGFGRNRAELDKKYRVNGDPANPWQYAYFQQDLPQYLVPFLIKEKILFIKPNQGSESVFQREGEQPCISSIPQAVFNQGQAPIRRIDQEIIERGRQSAQTGVTADPTQALGQVTTSPLPKNRIESS